jgi:exosortase/archaeosortase family protein
MAALFLGQLWNFPLRSRGILLGAGVLFAFVCNVARALILGFVAEKRGVEAINKWHDPAGFTILGVCFAGLFGLALLLRPKFGRALAAAESLPPPNRLPGGFVLGLAVWTAAVLAGTEIWYRSAPAATSVWWRVQWPEQRSSFQEIPLTPEVREMKFDSGRQARWREDDGSEWTMFYFRWLPGLATSRIVARWHNPDICLTAAGFKRVAEYAPLLIEKDGFQLAFRTYRFDVRDRKTFVFFCVWEDRAVSGVVPEQWTPASRWRAVLERKRKLGQQVLEVAISGIEDEEAAREAFETRVTALLHPDSIIPAESAVRGKSK